MLARGMREVSRAASRAFEQRKADDKDSSKTGDLKITCLTLSKIYKSQFALTIQTSRIELIDKTQQSPLNQIESVKNQKPPTPYLTETSSHTLIDDIDDFIDYNANSHFPFLDENF